MIHIHFSAADLCKITLASVPNAVFETALSVRRLRGSPAAGNALRPGLARRHREMSGSLAARAGLLMGLVLGEGFLPDFLLHPSGSSFADGFSKGWALRAGASRRLPCHGHHPARHRRHPLGHRSPVHDLFPGLAKQKWKRRSCGDGAHGRRIYDRARVEGRPGAAPTTATGHSPAAA